MSRRALHGIVVINPVSGLVWRVYDPPRWRVDMRALLVAKRLAGDMLAFLGRRVPAWAQVGRVSLLYRGALVPLWTVRDVTALVTWVDGVNGVPPEGLQ